MLLLKVWNESKKITKTKHIKLLLIALTRNLSSSENYGESNMICPHCGNNITKDADICNRCGKPTQFSLKFNYRPESAPIGSNSIGSNERSGNDNKSAYTDTTDIARVIKNSLPSKHTIQLWLYKYCGIFFVGGNFKLCNYFDCFFQFDASHGANNRKLTATPTMKPTLSPSPTPDQTPASAQIWFDKNMPRNVKEDQIKNFPNSEIKTEGSPFNLDAEPSLEGYLFTGWNTKEDGKGINFPKNSIFNFNPDFDILTLYAQWVKSDSGNTLISFNPNLPDPANIADMINMPDNVWKLLNKPLKLNQEPSLSGYRFVEWNTNEKGMAISIKTGSTLNLNLDVDTLTLYAQWKENN